MRLRTALAALALLAAPAAAEGFRILGVTGDGAVIYEEWGDAGESGYAFAAIRRADTAQGAAPPVTLGMADETDGLEREIDARTRAKARASRALGARPLPRPLQLATAPERPGQALTDAGTQRLPLAGVPRGRSVTVTETPPPQGAPDHGCADLLGRPPTDATLTLWGQAAPLVSATAIAEATGLAERCPAAFALRGVISVGQGGRVAAVVALTMPGQQVAHAVIGLSPP